MSDTTMNMLLELSDWAKKNAFVSVQDGSKLLSNECLQEQFLHSILTGLKNENTRTQLLKVNILKGKVFKRKAVRRWKTFGTFNFYHERWKWEVITQTLTIF